MKRFMYKVIGNATLKWKELLEVILDAEVSLNNRPLTYVEKDVQQPVLMPNLMINGQHYPYPSDDEEMTDEEDIKRRARYLKRCKDRLWKCWMGEYVRGLKERYNHKHKQRHVSCNRRCGARPRRLTKQREVDSWHSKKTISGKRRGGKRSRASDAKKHF